MKDVPSKNVRTDWTLMIIPAVPSFFAAKKVPNMTTRASTVKIA
jgi:hypothetical protein